MPRKISARAEIPAAYTLEEKPLYLPYDSALILSDLHCPLHSTLMLERALDTAAAHGVRNTVIIGDTWDFDELSSFPQIHRPASAGDTVRISGGVLNYIAERSAQTVITPGNHCIRFAKRLNAAWDMRFLVAAALADYPAHGEIVTTNYSYVYLGDSWLVGHPKKYSRTPGKTPAELADLYGRNVVTGHNHLVGFAPSKSGRWLGVDCGALTDPEAHAYLMHEMNDHPRWQSGFVIIDKGYCYPYSERFSDWR